MRMRTLFLLLITLACLGELRLLMAADPSPVPTPPAWIKPAFENTQVKIEYYDPAKDPKPFPGWTIFDSSLTYQFDSEYQISSTPGQKPLVVVQLDYSKVEFNMRHRVQLPKNYESPRIWETPLGQHELEHVAVGAHRRVALLANHLVRRVRRLERTVDKPSDVTQEWVDKVVRDELTPRRLAIDELIKSNNLNLDKLTGHGARKLDDRDAHFAQLYLKENLDEMKFPYLHEVLDLLERRDYQEARWAGALPKNKAVRKSGATKK